MKIIVLLLISIVFVSCGQNKEEIKSKNKYENRQVILTKDFLVENGSQYPFSINPLFQQNEFHYRENRIHTFLLKKGTTFKIGSVTYGGGGIENPTYSKLEVLSCSDKIFEKEFMKNAKINHVEKKHMYILTLHKEFTRHLKIN